MKTKVRQFFVPNGAVLVAAALAMQWKLQTIFATATGEFIVLAMLLAVVLLSWRFRSPRILLMALLLAIAELALTHLARGHSYGVTLVRTSAFLLPLNIAALLLIEEISFDLQAFRWWAAIVSAQVIMVAAWFRQGIGIEWLNRRLVKWPSLPLPQLCVLTFLLVAVLLLAAFFISNKPRESGMFWGLCALFAALVSAKPALAAGYFAVAALILAITVVETSYLIAYGDELTGLPARRAFNQAISALHGEYAIAMVDIDHFKQFNDSFGHDVGDQVLRMVGSKLAAVGGGGRAYRYGGEEFAIIFESKIAEEAFEQADKLRRSIDDTSFFVRGLDRRQRPRKERRNGYNKRPLRKKKIETHVTVSIGISEPRRDSTPVEEVVQTADKALYEAKERGRNRVEIYDVRGARAGA